MLHSGLDFDICSILAFELIWILSGSSYDLDLDSKKRLSLEVNVLSPTLKPRQVPFSH